MNILGLTLALAPAALALQYNLPLGYYSRQFLCPTGNCNGHVHNADAHVYSIPSVNIPDELKAGGNAIGCAATLRDQCKAELDTNWNLDFGWEQFIKAGEAIAKPENSAFDSPPDNSPSCAASPSFNVWSYCKCGWFPNVKTDTKLLNPEKRGDEPRRVDVTITLRGAAGAATDQKTLQTMVRDAMGSGGSEQSLANQTTKQALDISINDKEAVVIHINDNVSVDITWIFQNTETFGTVFGELKAVMEKLGDKQPQISHLRIDSADVRTLRDKVCA